PGNPGNGTSGGTLGTGGGAGTGGAGGHGGHGGQGGNGGDVLTQLSAKLVTYNEAVNLTAGNGGNSGTDIYFDNDRNIITSDSAFGGNGGRGGNITVEGEGHDVAIYEDMTFRTGNGGDNTSAADDVSAGNGGAVTFNLNDGGSLIVKEDLNLTFTKGTDGTKYGDAAGSASQAALAGVLDVKIDGSLNISQFKTVNMAITVLGGGPLTAQDDIHYDTMEFQKGSEFNTANTLGREGEIGTGGVEYSVNNLLVHSYATWNTAGAYFAGSNLNNVWSDKWSTFDTTDIHSNQVMLRMNDGPVNLENYDPVKQHLDYRNGDGANPFISSEYQLKSLDLGLVTLVTKTDGQAMYWDAGTPQYRDVIRVEGTRHYYDGRQVDNFAMDAGLRRYFWDVYVDQVGDNPLMADNISTADGYKTFLQGSLAGLSSLNQTFWSNTEPLMSEAASAALNSTVLSLKFGGSSLTTKTGSDIDVDNFSVGLALSRRAENSAGQTTLGLFLDYGAGSYDTYANIARLGELFGDGDVDHFGGGLFVRHLFNQGTYLEGSLRGGRLDNDYSLKRDSRFASPHDHSWDSGGNYFGAHLGLGQQFDLSEQTMLEVYGKLLWTRTNGDTVRTAYETYQFDNVNSVSSRLGARLNHTSESGLLKGYLGLAWEHEYDGQAEGSISGPGVPPDRIRNAPDLGGSSGFAEAGFSFKPAEEAMYSIDLGLFGLFGDREGFGGTVGFKFEF
ncbi:MAG: autotransporter outer membrane beta-barrel domain-containing protein, partial [Candidatus Adiutrix sp.]|nr:autotransporter outer membrane beta-barrel domain-containing protein [Candidatus Adiutrix sp.]